MSDYGGCCGCRCCFKLIFGLGFASLSIWLYLRASIPKCSIQYLYIPSLNKTLDTPPNSSLIFELKLDNGNINKGIYYDAVNLTFYDSPNGSQSQLMGSYVIPAFYQGYNKKATKSGDAEMNRTLLSQAVSPNESAVFLVELTTAVRFKIMMLKTKRRKLVRGANVEVNNQGAKVNDKGIKLRSGAVQEHGRHCAHLGVSLGTMMLILPQVISF